MIEAIVAIVGIVLGVGGKYVYDKQQTSTAKTKIPIGCFQPQLCNTNSKPTLVLDSAIDLLRHK